MVRGAALVADRIAPLCAGRYVRWTRVISTLAIATIASAMQISTLIAHSVDTPWTCTYCKQPIPDLDGFFDVYNANPDLAPVGGYPMEATPEEREVTRGEGEGFRVVSADALLERLGRGRSIGFRAYHRTCDPNPEGGAYTLPLREVATLEQWCALVMHLREKTWMGREDLAGLVAFWFTSRDINPHQFSERQGAMINQAQKGGGA